MLNFRHPKILPFLFLYLIFALSNDNNFNYKQFNINKLWQIRQHHLHLRK